MTESVLHVDLGHVSSRDALLLLGATEVTGVAEATNDGRTARIELVDGRIVAAGWSTDASVDATAVLAAVMHWSDGALLVTDDAPVTGGRGLRMEHAIADAERRLQRGIIGAAGADLDTTMVMAPELEERRVLLSGEAWTVLAALGAGATGRELASRLGHTELAIADLLAELRGQGLIKESTASSITTASTTTASITTASTTTASTDFAVPAMELPALSIADDPADDPADEAANLSAQETTEDPAGALSAELADSDFGGADFGGADFGGADFGADLDGPVAESIAEPVVEAVSPVDELIAMPTFDDPPTEAEASVASPIEDAAVEASTELEAQAESTQLADAFALDQQTSITDVSEEPDFGGIADLDAETMPSGGIDTEAPHVLDPELELDAAAEFETDMDAGEHEPDLPDSDQQPMAEEPLDGRSALFQFLGSVDK